MFPSSQFHSGSHLFLRAIYSLYQHTLPEKECQYADSKQSYLLK